MIIEKKLNRNSIHIRLRKKEKLYKMRYSK